MAVNIINPAALYDSSKYESTGYNAVDVLKYFDQKKTQDRRIKEQREYSTLQKMYDVGTQVMQNDFGIYQDEVNSAYQEGLATSVDQVKKGKSAAETLGNFSTYQNLVGGINKLNQDEKKYALFVDQNRLLSAEQKKTALDTRMKNVFYDADGNKRSLEDAVKASKDLKVNMAEFIDNESVYKDFLGNTQQSFRQDKVTGGVSSKMLYPWQTEIDGKVVVDLDDNGLIKEPIFASFMSDADRKTKVDYEAQVIADKKGITDLGEIENIKRELVTEMVVSHGDEGSKLQFQESRKYGTGTTKTYYDQKAEMQDLYDIKTPAADDTKLMPIPSSKGTMGIDVTDRVRMVDKTVDNAYLTPDGEYWVTRGVDAYKRPKYTISGSVDAMIKSTGNKYIQENWAKFAPEKTYTADTPDAEPTTQGGEPTEDVAAEYTYDDYRFGSVTNLGVVQNIERNGGEINIMVGGKSYSFESEEEFNEFATAELGAATEQATVQDM